jgi:hypothetical protein
MITLGLDPHPGSHTVVALDPNGALWPGSRFSIRRRACRNCISLPFTFLRVAGEDW